jgi:hypothetical protein
VSLASLTEKPEGVFLGIGGACVCFEVEALSGSSSLSLAEPKSDNLRATWGSGAKCQLEMAKIQVYTS